MKLESDIKLDFSDVLIRPKRSTLCSRSEVNLEREFKFIHSSKTWTGIPIMVSNMDTVGTIDMLKAGAENKILTCLHKHIKVTSLIEAAHLNEKIMDYVVLSTGISDIDWNNL